MGNFVINIFQEQFNLIDNLPDNEKKEVLYYLIQSKFNQDDCLEKQSSLSLSISLSKLSLSVIDIINKTMRIKEINDNHGGARKGAGAKQGNKNAIKEKQLKNNQETIKMIEIENKQVNVPDWLLDSTNYDLLTSLQREFVDNPEMRVLLNQFWGGKSSVRNDIANLYLQLLENRMKRQETKKMVGNLTDKLNVNSVENENSIEEISKTEEFSFAKTRNWQDVPTLYPRVYKKIENWINSDKFTGRGTKRNKTWIINLCETFNKKDEK